LGDLQKIGEKIQMAPLADSPATGTLTDDDSIDNVSWVIQPPESDMTPFGLCQMPEHDYLTILGVDTMHCSNFNSQMQYLPQSM
jgi:hypothetical protein